MLVRVVPAVYSVHTAAVHAAQLRVARRHAYGKQLARGYVVASASAERAECLDGIVVFACSEQSGLQLTVCLGVLKKALQLKFYHISSSG